MKQILRLFVAVGLLLGTSGCGEPGYYLQSIRGHLDVMAQRRSIPKVLADPQTAPALRQRLETVQDIRRFSTAELFLPDNDSFSTYADVGRDAVVWSVIAAPEDSLSPLTWCFPFAGCVPYRGYFHADAAEAYARRLRDDGYDVHVADVPAYSTLGWFSDPVLNTFINLPDWALAEVIVHELAHQVVYIKDDADFNEAFAQTVMLEGGRRWLATHGDEDQRTWAATVRNRQDAFLALVRRTRVALSECYGCETTREAKLACKVSTFADMHRTYAGLKTEWGGYSGYDDWMNQDLNNARFVSESTYYRLLPAFTVLLQQKNGDMKQFYLAVQALADCPAEERDVLLAELLSQVREN